MIPIVYAASGDTGIVNNALGVGVPTTPGAGLAFYIGTLWRTAVVLGGVAFLIFLIWGGLEYLVAGGDKTKIENAQHKISDAMIGLAILVASYAITLFIQAVFKINILQPVFEKNF